ncbi:MAG: heavy-metal-associated domain-containing protein [Bacteroidales bacterium]|nr:heavy-metal-associated domain-containing protein [Bacteroidales bacterium]
MNKVTIKVENLKCGGCASSVKKSLHKINEVKNVEVNVETSEVEISFDNEYDQIEVYKAKLKKLGYPEFGNNSTASITKSYVSCAIGKMQQ